MDEMQDVMDEMQVIERCERISREMGTLCGIGADEARMRPEGVAICAIYTGGVNVYSGIEKLAGAAGAELEELPFDGPVYRTERRFTHNGLEFFQLEGEKE